jgi:hypothetical protein
MSRERIKEGERAREYAFISRPTVLATRNLQSAILIRNQNDQKRQTRTQKSLAESKVFAFDCDVAAIRSFDSENEKRFDIN